MSDGSIGWERLRRLRVVFLDGGRVAATGTHDGLLAGTPRYGEVLAAAVEEPA